MGNVDLILVISLSMPVFRKDSGHYRYNLYNKNKSHL